MNFKSQLSFLVTCIIMTTANAHYDSYKENKICEHTKRAVQFFKSKKRKGNNNKPQLPTVKVACGDTISESVNIGNDLNCPDVTGFALKISGDDITVNGNGKKITAPNAAAAIYAEGENIKVANFTATDIPNGYGILAYNSPGIQILQNDFSRNSIGMMIYADNGVVDNVVVSKNKATQSVLFGVRTYSDAPGSIKNPTITNNDFRSSGDYAIYVMASTFEVEGKDNNNISGSVNGFYLKAGAFYIHDVNFSKQSIVKRHFFVDSAKAVVMEDVDVTSIAANNGQFERIGVDFYRVAAFSVKNLDSRKGDVALKLQTEQGVSPKGIIKDSSFSGQTFAGMHIVSYDGTPFGEVRVNNTKISTSSGAFDIFTQDGTVVDLSRR